MAKLIIMSTKNEDTVNVELKLIEHGLNEDSKLIIDGNKIEGIGGISLLWRPSEFPIITIEYINGRVELCAVELHLKAKVYRDPMSVESDSGWTYVNSVEEIKKCLPNSCVTSVEE